MVIWGVGLLSAIALSLSSSALLHSRSASNDVLAVQLREAANAGVAIAIAKLKAGHLKGPGMHEFQCRFEGAYNLVVRVEDEAGKIDLNFASTGLLERIFTGAGLSAGAAKSLAQDIADFRDGDNAFRRGKTHEDRYYRSLDLVHGPKNAPLSNVVELEQVPGMTVRLQKGPLTRYEALKRHFTVHSKRSGLDPRVADPELLRLIGGTGIGTPPQYTVRSSRQYFAIIVRSAHGGRGRFSRKAVVDIRPATGQSHKILAWGPGPKDSARPVASGPGVPILDLRDCRDVI